MKAFHGSRRPGLAGNILLATVVCLVAEGTGRTVPKEPPGGKVRRSAGVGRERILEAEQRQQRIAEATAELARRVGDLLETIRTNRLAEPELLQRWEQVFNELTTLSRQNMVRAAEALRRARLAGTDELATGHLRAASLEQREILARLLDLLREMEKRLALARLLDRIEQLLTDQESLTQRTLSTARQTLARPPEEQPAEEGQRRLADLAAEQAALRQIFAEIEEEMDHLARAPISPHRPPKTEPPSGKQIIRKALQQTRNEQIEEEMRRAEEELSRNRPVAAAEHQQHATNKLRRLRNLLRRQRENALLEQLSTAAEELSRIIHQEENLQQSARTLSEKAPTNMEPLKELAHRQNPITRRTGELKREMEGVVPQAAVHLRRAHEHEREAEDHLAARQPRRAAEQIARALRSLRAAKNSLDQERHRLTLALQREENAPDDARSAPTSHRTTNNPSPYLPPFGSFPPGASEVSKLLRNRAWQVSLPPRLRKAIIAALSDPFPAGFETLLRRYYEDLSQEAWDRLDLLKRTGQQP